jgi:Ca-activated chloride channel family protein
MFRFASPLYFLLLLFIPLMVWLRRRRQNRPSLSLSGLDAVRGIPGSPFIHTRHGVITLKYAALFLMIVAMARPQWGTERMNVSSQGINVVLALDLSGSMAALDFKKDGKIVNRLEAVKGVVRDFIAKREGDRIGLVVFGTNAFTQVPLTRDYNTISFVLDKLGIGDAGDSTAIGDAIGISVKRLADIESKSNVIILLTDGQSNAGELSPDIAADVAAQKKVKIYTIGVGTRGKAPFLVHDPIFGDRYVYQTVSIDEDTLKSIAEKTGGMYFRAEDTKGLADIYNTIDRMEKTEVKVQTFSEYREFYMSLLIPAFLILVFAVVLENTRYLRIP